MAARSPASERSARWGSGSWVGRGWGRGGGGRGGGRCGTGTSSTFGWIHGTGASSSGADSSAAWAAPWEARCRGGSSGTSTACSTATSAWRSRAVARSTFAQNPDLGISAVVGPPADSSCWPAGSSRVRDASSSRASCSARHFVEHEGLASLQAAAGPSGGEQGSWRGTGPSGHLLDRPVGEVDLVVGQEHDLLPARSISNSLATSRSATTSARHQLPRGSSPEKWTWVSSTSTGASSSSSTSQAYSAVEPHRTPFIGVWASWRNNPTNHRTGQGPT